MTHADGAVAVLASYPPASAELLSVLSARLKTSAPVLEAAALADSRLEVVCRADGLTTWDTEYVDAQGRKHYETRGVEAPKVTFIRMR